MSSEDRLALEFVQGVCKDEIAHRKRLEARVAELEAGLRPFAAIREAFGPSSDDYVFYECPTPGGGYVLVLGGDIERAAALLTPHTGERRRR